MEFLSLLRMLGSLALVLGLLVGALWLVRRYELRLPQNWLAGVSGRGSNRRMELVERLALDPRRSVSLIRVDGREHVVLIAPEGVVELGLTPAAPTPDATRPDASTRDAPTPDISTNGAPQQKDQHA